jgi:hypothetical protein
MKDSLYKALEARYQAEYYEAEATLEVYNNNAAGIGEHPQIIEEMAKMVEKMSNAEDCLLTLEENFREA